jgi:hypothetical protein
LQLLRQQTSERVIGGPRRPRHDHLDGAARYGPSALRVHDRCLHDAECRSASDRLEQGSAVHASLPMFFFNVRAAAEDVIYMPPQCQCAPRTLQSPHRCKPCQRRNLDRSPGPSGTHTIPRLCGSALSRSLGGSAVHGKAALNVADRSKCEKLRVSRTSPLIPYLPTCERTSTCDVMGHRLTSTRVGSSSRHGTERRRGAFLTTMGSRPQ